MNILRVKELFERSYAYCNLQYSDPDLLPCIIDRVTELATTKDWSLVEEYLNIVDDPLFLLNRAVLVSHCSKQKGFDTSQIENILDPDNLLNKWADSLSRLLLRIVQQTKDYDYLVQQILNYEDFLFYEMRFTLERRQTACEIYDLRGIDFFLIHYMEGEKTAHFDDALWNSANLIIVFLNESGRQEEATRVTEELKSRKELLEEIIAEYSSVASEPITETLENIRLTGERFWVDYLSLSVWRIINESSRRELLDAFVTEIMLKKGVLIGWSQVVLSLCKVVERELADVLFTRWIGLIQEANFSIPEGASKRELKRIKSREITFSTLKSCSEPPVHPPTLGQMVFVAKFWSDDIMNKCTPLFTTINNKTYPYCERFVQKVKQISRFLEDTHPFNHENPSLVDLRNASAHPGHEDDFTWSQHIPWLKEFLGKPPKEVLRTVAELKGE
ncbi:MAG: hypothetical protein C0631_02865 [Sedimenticola sp.]|nr:MAG: hypothetical protein C0631_02865 [Sedimenticola sp.]